MGKIFNMTNFTVSKSEENNHPETRKNYTAPEITHYGDIASLVLGFTTTTTDAPTPPFQRPS